MGSALIDSIRRAVDAAPADVPLRLHLAELLLADGQQAAAVAQVASALQLAPADPAAQTLMARVLGIAATGQPPVAGRNEATVGHEVAGQSDQSAASGGAASPGSTGQVAFDWREAEKQVGDLAEPMFVDEDAQPEPDVPAFEIQRSTITLADVGGMEKVKDRLQASFLAPMRNPELRRLYGKSLRGGLLLYGPPGCGKTFIARAVAGELGAKFLSIGINDVLDQWLGSSERNVHEAFQLARRAAPCVLFLDEVDALAQRRTQTRSAHVRTIVNQVLTELDGIDGANEGVFVLAATNQPWDVDPALRRPGRLDRTVLVLPPDAAARESIFRYHLQSRPVEGIDLRALAQRSDGLSGADIYLVCESASEHALMDGVRTGRARLIGMTDLLAALRETRPSILPWLDSARNVVMFGDDDGTYAELKEYLKRAKRL